jgi:hypothetical protein
MLLLVLVNGDKVMLTLLYASVNIEICLSKRTTAAIDSNIVRRVWRDLMDPVQIETNMLSHPDDLKAAITCVQLCREYHGDLRHYRRACWRNPESRS